VTPQQFGERFGMLPTITGARDPKQQVALVCSLKRYPKPLWMLPDTLQAKSTALKQQLLQQLGVDPEQTQQLISRQPVVLAQRAGSLVDKAAEQGQLLDLEAADVVVQLWTRKGVLMNVSTQLLHAKLAQLQLLLQPYMSPADVRQLVMSQPGLLASHAAEAVRGRLIALQECLPAWTPQQLGSALLTYPTVLMSSPNTIRHKWRIASQYRDMYMLGTLQQKDQQQQEQPHQPSALSLFVCSAERYALLEYIMMQQQQQQQQQQQSIINSSDSTGSNNSQGSQSDGGAHSSHAAPLLIVLQTRKHHFERLLQEHYPGFRQWHKQRQQAAKRQGQQPGYAVVLE
jgi:hypothetical protein